MGVRDSAEWTWTRSGAVDSWAGLEEAEEETAYERPSSQKNDSWNGSAAAASGGENRG